MIPPPARRLIVGCLVLAALGPTTGRGGTDESPAEPPLYRSEVRLAPTSRQLATLPAAAPEWMFTPAAAASLGTTLEASGFNPDLRRTLLTRLEPVDGGVAYRIAWDAPLLDRFSPSERVAWQRLLWRHHGNTAARWPLSFTPAELAAIDADPRWTAAAARLHRWGRPHGDRLVFSELAALDDAFASPSDRAAFLQQALGGAAPVLKLRRHADQPLDPFAQAAWWQVNGRHRAIEPLLNAVAAMPDAPRLDVVHLLPRLPRALLDTYPPNLADADDPDVDSDLLAADFFEDGNAFDPRAPGGFRAWLARGATPITGPPHYGDIVVFDADPATNWPYAGVYVADHTVFARRPTANGPWQFLDLAEVGRLNPRLAGVAPRFYRTVRPDDTPADPPFVPGRLPAAWRQRLRLRDVKPGPWGRLRYYDVLLAPAGRTLAQLPAPSATPVWTFTGISRDELLAAAGRVPMPDAVRRDLTALFAAATPDAQGNLTVHPSLDLVLAVPREFRTAVFAHLVGSVEITDYTQHIPFPAGFTIDEWFDAGSLPETVRAAILRLAYPLGDRVMLSDFGALYHLLDDPRERLSAQRAALRVPAVVVLLEKPGPEEVPALAAYWQTDRAKDMRTLLDSLARDPAAPRYLDIVNLLSPIEREFIDTYFTPDQPSLTPSCFWTAFNFGADQPDNRFLVQPGVWSDHEALAWQELQAHFTRLDAPSQLGDIIGYKRKGSDELLHACVFIADGIVYTKNGAAFSMPWCLSRLADIDELYLTGPDMERVYFRRRERP